MAAFFHTSRTPRTMSFLPKTRSLRCRGSNLSALRERKHLQQD